MVDGGIPKPDQLEGFLGDIEHAIAVVRDGYRWLYPDSHRKPKHASRELVSGGAEHDVGDIVLATERPRAKIRDAARAVVEARNALGRAVADLNDVMALLDPPPSIEVSDVRLLQHPAHIGDLERAREAQARRLTRARRTGDYGEGTG